MTTSRLGLRKNSAINGAKALKSSVISVPTKMENVNPTLIWASARLGRWIMAGPRPICENTISEFRKIKAIPNRPKSSGESKRARIVRIDKRSNAWPKTAE
jgi:hypothetical protein